MKQKVILFSLVLLLLVSCVSALEVELTFPEVSPAYFVDSNNVDFKCKATTNGQDGQLSLMYLYTDISGTWDITDSDLNPQYDTESIFTVENLENRVYNWNCRAISAYNDTFGQNSKQVIIDFQNPPTFFGSIENQEWNSNEIKTNAFLLEDYFLDSDSILDYNYTIDSENISVTIASNNEVTFIQDSGWTGTANIVFHGCDEATCADSNQITLTVNPGTPSCTDTIWSPPTSDYCEGEEFTQTSNCDSIRTEIGTKSCTDDECTDDDDCSSGYICDDGDCVKEEDEDEFEDELTDYGNDEFTIEITKAIPSYNNIKIKPEESKKFEIETNTNEIVWYLDNETVEENSESYIYTPTSSDIGEHIIKVIAGIGTDKDMETWDIKVEDETIPTESLCGNDKADVNETCLNCPQDIPCQEGEYCDEGICKTKNLNLITGFATKTKNFVVQSWYYPTLILSIIVLLIIILKITKLKKKPKKDEYLAEFSEKKTLLKRFRKKLREWDRKKQLKKQNKETLKRIKTEKENNIRVIAPGIESIIAFVNQKVSEGTPKRQIKRVLKRKGWSRKQIRKAFKRLKNDSRKPT